MQESGIDDIEVDLNQLEDATLMRLDRLVKRLVTSAVDNCENNHSDENLDGDRADSETKTDEHVWVFLVDGHSLHS